MAHGEATGIVKERMDLMKGIGDAMKRLAPMFKGQAAYDPEAVREAAQVIRSRAGDHITELFPEHSLQKPTEALPAIWEDWTAFEGYARDLETYSITLEAAAGNGFAQSDASGNKGVSGSQGLGLMISGGQGENGNHSANDSEALKGMPPMASFMRLSETCNACHTRFRMKK